MTEPLNSHSGKCTMKIEDHWPEIQRVVMNGRRSSRHCAIASVGESGVPTITPIGTVFLRSDYTGFFFDQYTNALAQNVALNPNVCVMAINSSSWFWLRSLVIGRFVSPPGVRLYGKVHARRLATVDEMMVIENKVWPTHWLRGSRLLWSNFSHVRDIQFTSFRPVTYPVMMEHLWSEGYSSHQ